MKFYNLVQLTEHFSNNDTCRKYLENMRWGGNPYCPYCKNTKVYKFSDNKNYKCAKCRKRFTATVGTIFENTNIPLRKWFIAIYLATSHKKGIASLQLSKDLGITQKSAWYMLHRIREMLRNKSPDMLQNMVEADETFFGGKAKNMSAKKRKELKAGTGVINMTGVFGMLERKGKVKTEVIPEAKGEILKPIIRKNIDNKATLITDGFGGYKDLNKEFKHEIIYHSKDEFVRGKFHTNTIEGFFSLLKRGQVGIFHKISPKHLQRYCDEFEFRYNTKHLLEVTRFNRALKQCVGRMRYKELISNK